MTQPGIHRGTMRGGLLQIRQCGLLPGTVIDVGTALGTFALYSAFPECKHFMIEPIAENEPYLAKLCQKLGNADYIIAAASDQSGTMNLHVNSNLVHSSTVTDADQPVAPSFEQRTIPTVTLDQLCQEKQLPPPYLIKIDVDGNEAEVLKGAVNILPRTEYLIIESTLFGQIYDVIDFMRSHDFVMYDILDPSWRPGDRALWQVDLAFVKVDSPFRTQTFYIEAALEPRLAKQMEDYRQAYIQQIEDFPDLKQTSESLSLIAFPNWHQPEENLFAILADLLRFALTHAQRDTLSLLIHSGTWNSEDANEAISSVLLYLMSEEGIEAGESPEIVLIEPFNLTPLLITQLSGRVALAAENHVAIQASGAAHLPVYSIQAVSA
ncbi:FkbM family methyltransferase [Leptolyngbya sp. ST-U4]|uniref:FkbM family methyltransferase n=1 Tax=Leptolyngbya sp. ST-U4 TaxID=2933912 RepID=UPI001988A898|nr:FkbM family methyltransferase [Cyanobacteria bacterium FACHB-502]